MALPLFVPFATMPSAKTEKILLCIIALGGCAATVWSGLEMQSRPFWGQLTLYFCMGFWVFISALYALRKAYTGRSRRPIYLSTLSGLLLGKAFVYTSPLAWVGFVPLLVSTLELDSEGRCRYLTHGLHAFHAFVVWNIAATYWVANASLVPGCVAFGLNSLFMATVWLAALWVRRRWAAGWLPALVSFWLSFEWLHHQWEISWPWLSLGNAMAFFPDWVQWYEYTGAFGGGLWIWSLNLLAFAAWSRRSKRLHWLAGWCAMAVLPVLGSAIMLARLNPEGIPVEVVVVQPNYEPHYEKFAVDPNIQMDNFEELSRQKITPDTRYIVWPETSFEYLRTHSFEGDWRVQRMRTLASANPDLCLVSGIGSIREFAPGETLTSAARKSRPGSNAAQFEVQNSAIQVCNGTEEIPLYVKSKLVPGVETFPYRQLLPFLKPIVDQLGGSIYGLGRQPDRSVFLSDGLAIAPVICYESIYGAYVGEYIRKGAQAIFIMTNDGWWDDTPGYRQHLAFGTLRAIEYRRPIARAANTGISCFVDARGIVHEATSYNERIAVKGTLLFSNGETFYLKHGDYVAHLALALSLGILLWILLSPLLKVRLSESR
jgi:apolipoprotein N-acyltransferase